MGSWKEVMKVCEIIMHCIIYDIFKEKSTTINIYLCI